MSSAVHSVTPRAILFDLFDTLVPAGWNAGGYHPGDQMDLREEFDLVWGEWGHRRMTSRIPFGELLNEVYRVAGLAPDTELIERLVKERSAYKAQLLRSVDGSIVDMLRSCRSRGLRIGLVTGCACEDVESWEGGTLASLLDTAVFSCDVGVMKPDPAIYEIAVDRLGIRAADALFVGDGVGSELQGALNAGLAAAYRATWIIDRSPSPEEPSFPKLETPSSLLQVLEKSTR